MAVFIVAIVFSFTAFSAYLDYNRKREKDKINAALRMEEMRRGYRPGTYSSYSPSKKEKKKHRKHYDDDFDPYFDKSSQFKDDDKFTTERNKERADLRAGIDDLMTRINNLEVIMESEKEKGK